MSVQRSEELTEKIERMKKSERLDDDRRVVKKQKTTTQFGSVLTATEDLDSIRYTPRTRESRLAYEEILTVVATLIGDQPQDILRGAADEILALLKDDNMRDLDRIKVLLSPLLSRRPS